MATPVNVIAALIRQGTKVLLVRKGGLLQLPGGKRSDGETSIACLRREVREQVPVVAIVGVPEHWRVFKDLISPRSGHRITVSVYKVKIRWRDDGAVRTESESVTEELWWQGSMNVDDLTEPTQHILQEAGILKQSR